VVNSITAVNNPEVDRPVLTPRKNTRAKNKPGRLNIPLRINPAKTRNPRRIPVRTTRLQRQRFTSQAAMMKEI
jgi:hypothetical protein